MDTKMIVGSILIIITIAVSGQTEGKGSTQKQTNMEQQKFTAKKETWTRVMHTLGSANETFPLLCPVREYDWIPTWKCNMIYSESGVAEDMCVFKTHFSLEEDEETWVCTYYEKDRRIEYLHYYPNRIERLRIALIEEKPTTSDWKWETSVIGLNEAGNKQIESMEQSRQFFAINERLEKELNFYLCHHKMIDNNNQ